MENYDNQNELNNQSFEGDETNKAENQPTENQNPYEESAEKSSADNMDENPSEYAFRWNYEAQDAHNKADAKKKHRAGVRNYAILMTLAFLLCFGSLVAVLIIDDYSNVTQKVYPERTIFVREYDKESGVLTIAEIASKVTPSVVAIQTTTTTGTGLGTGIIISEDGYIATNSHVIETANSVSVVLYDGSEYEAEVIGKDSLSDLAVIKIKAEGLSVAEFGDSDSLVVGEPVVAIGNPAELELANTVTDGIISAISRDVKIMDETTGALIKTMTLIQTNACINFGNSGGPLINEYGKVIGINTLKLGGDYDGIGFSIPINAAKKILDSIIETGGDINENSTDVAKKRAMLGIKGTSVSRGVKQEINGAIYNPEATGVMVVDVTEGYDAFDKLLIGDIIIAVNDESVTAVSEISNIINQFSDGDSVKLKIHRDGKIQEIEIVLSYEK